MLTWPCTVLLALITETMDDRLTTDALIQPHSCHKLSLVFFPTKEAQTWLFSTEPTKLQCVFRSWRNSSTASVKGRHSSWHWLVAGWIWPTLSLFFFSLIWHGYLSKRYISASLRHCGGRTVYCDVPPLALQSISSQKSLLTRDQWESNIFNFQQELLRGYPIRCQIGFPLSSLNQGAFRPTKTATSSAL